MELSTASNLQQNNKKGEAQASPLFLSIKESVLIILRYKLKSEKPVFELSAFHVLEIICVNSYIYQRDLSFSYRYANKVLQV